MLHHLICKLAFIIIIFNAAASPLYAQSFFQIDNLDSVVFDIEQSTINGNYVEFPVSFKSDDSIYALDFSFKYNQLNFLYDSTINLTSGLSVLAYYNPNDSIVRLTSYSLATLPNDSPIVKLRFQVLAGTFCNTDLNTVKGYLNGDFCSNKVVNCNTTGISESKLDKLFKVYPNPATEKVFLEIQEFGGTFYVTELCGKQLTYPATISDNYELSLSSFQPGIYFIILEIGKEKIIRKLSVLR